MLGDRPLDLAQPVHRRIRFWNQTDFNWRKFPIFVVAGHVEGGKVSHYQVTIKIGFTVKG